MNLTSISSIIRTRCRSTLVSMNCKMHGTLASIDDAAEEIRISVPWGHVAGKWWGPKNVRPIVCVHGWQDNAGSFDRLIPLLPKHLSYLAIDLPGHGKSSWYPHGMHYHVLDYAQVLNLIKNEYKWDKISLLGHSVGSITCFNYSGLFPKNIDMMIGIDFLKNHIYPAEKAVALLQRDFKTLLEVTLNNQKVSEPPSYTFEEATKRLCEGSNNSVTPETSLFLLRRNLKESKKHPGKYYFSRDIRLKNLLYPRFPQEINKEFAKHIKIPYLFIKASKAKLYEERKYLDDMIEAMQSSNPNFEWKTFEGTHHIHLTSPEVIVDALSIFICKVRPPPQKEVGEKSPVRYSSSKFRANLCSMYTHTSPLQQQDEAEEVKISVPWGHVAGKWWGPKDVRPIVCVHGWQDNAGSFDRLIPLLPKYLSYLAIDLPGHGHSSWYPDGMNYNPLDYVNVLNCIRKEYDWDKVSLLAHSLGSILTYNYCSLFPDRVDLAIGIDALKSHIRSKERVASVLEYCFDQLLIADERNRSKSEPPAYPFEETVKKLNEATNGSVTLDTCHHILRRNLKKSEKYPDKYYFARDNRLKYTGFMHIPQEVTLEFAKRLRMPYLFIKASKSPFYEKREYFDETIEIMKQNPNFEWHMIEGTHHLHLTAPETVSEIISNFIIKARPSVDSTNNKSKL